MLIGLTGTPGTGKTSISRLLEKNRGWKVIHLNDLIKEQHLYTEIDDRRDAVIADMDLVREYLQEILDGNNLERKQRTENEVIIIESHLAHYIADVIIVLRTYPPDLEMRLKTRGYSEEKIKENFEAEALDVILVEAFEWCQKVFEVNTTGKSVEEAGQDIEKIIDNIISGKEEELSEYKPGSIDWIDLVP
jgi:adenylate kinase